MNIIKARWIDINKGDDENPNYRSRFVAKEFNQSEEQGLFAGTPPLEAMRYIIHRAATVGKEENIIMINVVARAFFEATVKRAVCVEVPEEDIGSHPRPRLPAHPRSHSLEGPPSATQYSRMLM